MLRFVKHFLLILLLFRELYIRESIAAKWLLISVLMNKITPVVEDQIADLPPSSSRANNQTGEYSLMATSTKELV